MARRITQANIKYVSLVPRGANRLPVIYKADGEFDLDMLMKAGDDFADKGELTAVVYSPEMRDSQGDIASASVIKEMLYNAAKEGLSIDIRHDSKALPKSQAFIAENFIVQKDDPRFAGMKDYSGKPVDVTGAWGVVVKIEDKELRNLYKQGKWNGVSMGGTARVEADNDLAEKVIKGLAQRMGLTPQGESLSTGDIDMDKKELEEILTKSNETLVGAIAKALKPEAPKDEKPKEKEGASAIAAPVFKGDYTNAEDVKKHADAVKRYNLVKDLDWNDPVAVEKYQEALAALTPAEKKDEKAPEASEEVKKLEKELAEARKRSNVPASKGDKSSNSSDNIPDGISKEDADCFATGAKMAKAMNGAK